MAAIVRSWSWPRICPLARSLAHHPPPGPVVPPFCDRSHSGTNGGEQAVGWSVRPSAVHVATSSVQSCDRLHESRPSLPRHSAKSMSQSPFLLFLSSSRPLVRRVRPSIAMIRHHFPPVFNRRRCRRHVFARLIWPSLPPILPPFFPSTPSVASYGRNVATAAAVDLSVGREQPMPQFVEARAGAGTVSRQVTASAATRPSRRPILHVEKSRKCRRGGGAGRRKRS